MSIDLDDLKPRLEMLPREQRADLVVFLLESLEAEGASAESDWDAEAARRAAEVHAGTAVGRTLDEVLDAIRMGRP